MLSGYDLVVDSVGGENLMKSLTVLKPAGLAISVTGPPDAGFAKQLGAPKPFEFVLSFLSRKVRRAARKLGVRYEFFFMHASGATASRACRPVRRRPPAPGRRLHLRLRQHTWKPWPTSRTAKPRPARSSSP